MRYGNIHFGAENRCLEIRVCVNIQYKGLDNLLSYHQHVPVFRIIYCNASQISWFYDAALR